MLSTKQWQHTFCKRTKRHRPSARMGQVFSYLCEPLQRIIVFAAVSALSAGAVYLPGHYLRRDHLNNMIHLFSFSTWIGTQFWVTFISGFAMIKVLPRHMFGLAQSRLFPAYFLVGTTLSSITLSTYAVENPISTWVGHTRTQGIVLSTAVMANALNFLYLEPQTTKLMFENHRYERAQGEGDEGQTSVGTLSNSRLQDDPVYRSMRNRFFMWHGISATANLVAYAASGYHLWSLSQNLPM